MRELSKSELATISGGYGCKSGYPGPFEHLLDISLIGAVTGAFMGPFCGATIVSGGLIGGAIGLGIGAGYMAVRGIDSYLMNLQHSATVAPATAI